MNTTLETAKSIINNNKQLLEKNTNVKIPKYTKLDVSNFGYSSQIIADDPIVQAAIRKHYRLKK